MNNALARGRVTEAVRNHSWSVVLQQRVGPLRQTTDAEEMETAALRELLTGRHAGEFVDAGKWDALSGAMVVNKHRAYCIPS